MNLKIDKIKDYVVNLYLQIRLFVILKLNIDIDDRHMLEYKLTFIDGFNKGSLDRKKWITKSYQGYRYHSGTIEGDNKAPSIYFADNAFAEKDGILDIITTDESIKIKHVDWNGMDWGYFKILYRTGQIDSSQYFRQKYGYYEIRSKMPDQIGQFPAFCLTTIDAYPSKIDIYEVNTTKGFNKLATTIHWGKTPDNKRNTYTHRVKDVSKDFHNYSLEWEEGYMKFFYDKILIRKITERDVLKEFKYKMHIIINGAVLANENPEKAKYPTNYYIDYVKAYKRI